MIQNHFILPSSGLIPGSEKGCGLLVMEKGVWPILSLLVLLILISAALGYSTILAEGLGIRKKEQKTYI